MSIPKSTEECTRFIVKMRVWALFIGGLCLLLILYVKSGWQHKLFQMFDTYKPELHMASLEDDESVRSIVCLHEERNGHVVDIDLPNEHTFRDALEGSGSENKSMETMERERRDNESRGESPSLEGMV